MKTFWVVLVLLILLPLVWRRVSKRLRILDKPGHDVPKRPRVPTLQWLGFLVAVVGVTALFHPEYFTADYMLGFWIGLWALVVVNFIDELGRLVHRRYRLHPVIKFIVQLLVAIVAWRLSGIGISGIEIAGQRLSFSVLNSLILTIARFGLCINAINRFDGVYGLASWSSSLGFFTIASLLTRVVLPLYPEMTGLKLEMVNSAIWFARLFAGVTLFAALMEFRPLGLVREVGTMSFGFALAYLSLLGGAKLGTVIVVLLLPLLDAVRVIFDRLHIRKQNPFKGDFTHLHYRLMALGWNRTEVRVVLWSLSAFLAIIILLQGGDRISKLIIFVLIAVIFFAINGYLYRVKKLPKAYIPGIKSDDDLEKNYVE